MLSSPLCWPHPLSPYWLPVGEVVWQRSGVGFHFLGDLSPEKVAIIIREPEDGNVLTPLGPSP